ncbi:hypothetical protein STEG23_011045, partial [Scotinomys teguina]
MDPNMFPIITLLREHRDFGITAAIIAAIVLSAAGAITAAVAMTNQVQSAQTINTVLEQTSAVMETQHRINKHLMTGIAAANQRMDLIQTQVEELFGMIQTGCIAKLKHMCVTSLRFEEAGNESREIASYLAGNWTRDAELLMSQQLLQIAALNETRVEPISLGDFTNWSASPQNTTLLESNKAFGEKPGWTLKVSKRRHYETRWNVLPKVILPQHWLNNFIIKQSEQHMFAAYRSTSHSRGTHTQYCKPRTEDEMSQDTQSIVNKVVGNWSLETEDEMSQDTQSIVNKVVGNWSLETEDEMSQDTQSIVNKVVGNWSLEEDVILEWIFRPRKPNKNLKTYIEKISDLIHK